MLNEIMSVTLVPYGNAVVSSEAPWVFTGSVLPLCGNDVVLKGYVMIFKGRNRRRFVDKKPVYK